MEASGKMVKRVFLSVFENAAVPIVGSGFGEKIHLPAQHAPVLGRWYAFDGVYLLDASMLMMSM